jgi:hypothetical protein
MAERRMFAKNVIDSDLFLEMPLSTQALYFHLAMRADDDGFVNNPKKISRMIGADEESLRILISKAFLIPFDTGIVVIRHWKIHNYIRKDTYKSTAYKAEKAALIVDESNKYATISETVTVPSQLCNESVDGSLTQDRLGKDRLGKDSIYKADESANAPTKTKRFTKPSLEEVKAYCAERKNNVDAEKFIDYYESNGWKVGKNPMKDWKAAVRNWEKSNFAKPDNKDYSKCQNDDFDISKYETLMNRFDL